MLLCIDCGNTNTVVSIWDGAAFLATFRTSTEFQRTADQYFVWLSTLMDAQPRALGDRRGHHLLDRAAGAVQPARLRRPLLRLPAAGGRQARLPACRTTPRVDPGTQVGPDRIVNTTGAFDRHGGDLIVRRFRHRHHLRRLRRGRRLCRRGDRARGQYLARSVPRRRRRAALYRRDPPGKGDRHQYRRLHAGRASGGAISAWSAISARAIRAEYGRPMKIIGTGGLAPLFARVTCYSTAIEEDLTMHGLTVIHRYNKERICMTG